MNPLSLSLSLYYTQWILSLIAVDSLGSLTRWQSSSPPPPPLPAAAAAALWTPPPAVCLERGLAGATASLSVSDASTPVKLFLQATTASSPVVCCHLLSAGQATL